MGNQRAYLLRSLCFFEAIGYAPTVTELLLSADTRGEEPVGSMQELQEALNGLFQEGLAAQVRGRVGFVLTVQALVAEIETREHLQARKRRRAAFVTRWLLRLGGVRFIALANTTAWGYARDAGDLDFFVIVKRGSIWQTRLLAVFPFKFLHWLPGPKEGPDAVCLSYFIADSGLDLSKHQLSEDDPYFRQWFLALQPLYDDGVGKELWEKNSVLRARHPWAAFWSVSPDLQVVRSRLQFPVFQWFEIFAEWLQRLWFPQRIRELSNIDSRVMVNEHVLKFHTDDGREMYRSETNERCTKYGI
jgi:hypothetical protein